MKKTYVWLAAIFLIVVSTFIVARRALTISGGGGSFRYCVGANCGVDWNDDGTLSLTNEATQTVTTNVFYVESCVATQDTPAATVVAHRIYCKPADQTAAATRGKIYISADTDGATGTVGTTKVHWIALGYGAK